MEGGYIYSTHGKPIPYEVRLLGPFEWQQFNFTTKKMEGIVTLKAGMVGKWNGNFELPLMVFEPVNGIENSARWNELVQKNVYHPKQNIIATVPIFCLPELCGKIWLDPNRSIPKPLSFPKQ